MPTSLPKLDLINQWSQYSSNLQALGASMPSQTAHPEDWKIWYDKVKVIKASIARLEEAAITTTSDNSKKPQSTTPTGSIAATETTSEPVASRTGNSNSSYALRPRPLSSPSRTPVPLSDSAEQPRSKPTQNIRGSRYINEINSEGRNIVRRIANGEFLGEQQDCDKCVYHKRACVGSAGVACDPCAKLHSRCSNRRSTSNVTDETPDPSTSTQSRASVDSLDVGSPNPPLRRQRVYIGKPPPNILPFSTSATTDDRSNSPSISGHHPSQKRKREETFCPEAQLDIVEPSLKRSCLDSAHGAQAQRTERRARRVISLIIALLEDLLEDSNPHS